MPIRVGNAQHISKSAITSFFRYTINSTIYVIQFVLDLTRLKNFKISYNSIIQYLCRYIKTRNYSYTRFPLDAFLALINSLYQGNV